MSFFDRPEVLYTAVLYKNVCMYGLYIEQSMEQPGKIANPARGQLNREN